MRVQSEEAGLLGEDSVLHGPLPAQEGSTHFRVTVSMSGQQLCHVREALSGAPRY